MLKSHPNRASYPKLVFGDVDGILIHLKYRDDADLISILEELKGFVPETTVTVARTYRARLTTENRESLKNSIKFAILTYIITFFASLAIGYQYILSPRPEVGFLSITANAALTSVPPMLIALLSKKVERLGEIIRRE